MQHSIYRGGNSYARVKLARAELVERQRNTGQTHPSYVDPTQSATRPPRRLPLSEPQTM